MTGLAYAVSSWGSCAVPITVPTMLKSQQNVHTFHAVDVEWQARLQVVAQAKMNILHVDFVNQFKDIRSRPPDFRVLWTLKVELTLYVAPR